jgi:hypothetical protein
MVERVERALEDELGAYLANVTPTPANQALLDGMAAVLRKVRATPGTANRERTLERELKELENRIKPTWARRSSRCNFEPMTE